MRPSGQSKRDSSRPRVGRAKAPGTGRKRPKLTAYQLYETPIRVEPAPLTRQWMDETDKRFAYRCLPLVIANQAGWIITGCPGVIVRWNGGAKVEDLVVESLEGEENPAAVSHFGHGIVTWRLPLIFRTSPGFNLLVRGIPNLWKDGAIALEGIIETDWSVMTFTMNWRLTRPGEARFETTDPLCFIVPQRRGELESFATSVHPIEANTDLDWAYNTWAEDRRHFIATSSHPEWKGYYLRGTSPTGHTAPEHQLRLQLSPFGTEAVPAGRKSSARD